MRHRRLGQETLEKRAVCSIAEPGQNRAANRASVCKTLAFRDLLPFFAAYGPTCTLRGALIRAQRVRPTAKVCAHVRPNSLPALGELLKPAMRTRSQRSQRSDGSRELAPLSLSALPEAVLEHTLTFVDENDDGRCRAISKSWARLRRVWILPYPKIDRDQHGEVNAVIFSPDGYLLAVGANEHPPVKLYDVR